MIDNVLRACGFYQPSHHRHVVRTVRPQGQCSVRLLCRSYIELTENIVNLGERSWKFVPG